MILAESNREAKDILEEKSYKFFEPRINDLGFSYEELSNLDVVQLQSKIDSLNKIINDHEKVISIGVKEFRRDKDYKLPPNEDPRTTGFGFSAYANLYERRKYIFDIIRKKTRIEKVDSLGGLIDNIVDKDLKEKLVKELKDFNTQVNELEVQEKINNENELHKSSIKQLEITEKKLEVFEKKSKIWMTILAKESIASVIGAFLLIVIAISLIVSMFLGTETTEIVESAFLLILGYFFGHAVSKK